MICFLGGGGGGGGISAFERSGKQISAFERSVPSPVFGAMPRRHSMEEARSKSPKPSPIKSSPGFGAGFGVSKVGRVASATGGSSAFTTIDVGPKPVRAVSETTTWGGGGAAPYNSPPKVPLSAGRFFQDKGKERPGLQIPHNNRSAAPFTPFNHTSYYDGVFAGYLQVTGVSSVHTSYNIGNVVKHNKYCAPYWRAGKERSAAPSPTPFREDSAASHCIVQGQ